MQARSNGVWYYHRRMLKAARAAGHLSLTCLAVTDVRSA